ncbi:hypothetical protein JXQ31_16885 [candidate division KSB1 bacterium]|nr:hypothetical protein [candidate division KSB1 bacterium]
MKEKNSENTTKAIRKELLTEIGALRSQFRDIISRYQTNLEAEMVWCIKSLSETEMDELPKAAKDKSNLLSIINTIKKLKIKPQKGRLKDIRKINNIIKEISDNLSE